MEEVIQTGLTPVDIRLHISSISLKVLMIQIPFVITKKVTHLKQNQLCAYHVPTKEKHKCKGRLLR
jgi:hypothetical protein